VCYRHMPCPQIGPYPSPKPGRLLFAPAQDFVTVPPGYYPQQICEKPPQIIKHAIAANPGFGPAEASSKRPSPPVEKGLTMFGIEDRISKRNFVRAQGERLQAQLQHVDAQLHRLHQRKDIDAKNALKHGYV